jgi:hypothetical protein
MSSYCQCHNKVPNISSRYCTIVQMLQNEIKNQNVPSCNTNPFFLFPGSRKLCLKLALLPRLLLMQVSGMTANCVFFGFHSCYKRDIFSDGCTSRFSKYDSEVQQCIDDILSTVQH